MIGYVGAPMFLLLAVVVGVFISMKVTEFIDARGKLMIQINQLVTQMDEFPGDRMDEIEAIRREHLDDIHRELLQYIVLALSLIHI